MTVYVTLTVVEHASHYATLAPNFKDVCLFTSYFGLFMFNVYFLLSILKYVMMVSHIVADT